MRNILILVAIFILPLNAYAGKVYTDQDLKQYKQAGDGRSNQSSGAGRMKEESLSDKLDNISNKYNQDYWCRWSTYHENEVNNASQKHIAAVDHFNKTDSDVFF